MSTSNGFRWTDRASSQDQSGGSSWIRGPTSRFYRPADTARHAGTMMCWPTTASVAHEDESYGGASITATRAELAGIARTIARYEPVHLVVHARGTSLASARELLGDVANVEMHVTTNVYSLWARDTGPLSVYHRPEQPSSEAAEVAAGFEDGEGTSRESVGVVLNFNHWGRKLDPSADMYTAPWVCETLRIPACQGSFIGEGGALEFDGAGTFMATESSLLNPNRNPGMSKETLEGLLRVYFGIRKAIWIPGRRGWDITDDHIDSLARFGAPGTVLLSRPHAASEMPAYEEAKAIIERSTTHDGAALKVVDLPEPDPAKVLGKDYDPAFGPCVSYANFYTVNGAVLVAAFGDEAADSHAARVIGAQFPDRIVEQVPLHQLAFQGGGIHCATQQIFA